MEISKKWTVRNFFSPDEVKELVEQNNGSVKIATILGICGKASVGSSNFGEYVKLLGNFQATNLVTGEVVRTSTVLLPDVLANLVYAEIEKGSEAVEFAFNIIAKKAATPTGYQYYGEPVMQTTEADPLANLLQKTQDKIKLLDAPKESVTKGDTKIEPAKSTNKKAS